MPSPENLYQNVLPWNTVIKIFVFEVSLHGKKGGLFFHATEGG